MWTLARRNLFGERVRLAVSVGGVAFAVLLIVLLRGVFVAYQSKIGDYYRGVGADLWVVQQGTPDFVHAFSLVPDDARRDIAALPGVARVRPYLARQVGFRLDGQDVLLDLVGFDPADDAGGPTKVVEGTRLVGRDGMVVDRVFAATNGVDLDDVLTLNGVRLRVTGISTGSDMVMYQSAFAAMPTTRRILGMPAHDQALLVSLAPAADRASVTAAVQAAVPDVTVYSTDELVTRNQKPLNESFMPIIGVLVGIGFLVGVTVIGLTTYSAVLERRREFGVLKAVGARGSQMLRLVLVQALLAAAAGYALGLGLAATVGWAAAAWVPQFVTNLQLVDLAAVAVAALVMAAVAASIPLVRIARIDPGDVFRT